MSPPIEVEELQKVEKTLQTLRDALKLKGKIEIATSKAKLLKDESWVQGEEFEKMKAELATYDAATLSRLDGIKREKLNWNNDAEEVGINIDDELDEEEIGQRFTKLKPEGGRPSRFGGDDRDGRGRGGRGRSQGPRQQPRRDDRDRDPRRDDREPRYQDRQQDAQQQQQQPRAPKKEKFNGTNAEDFPSL